MTTATRLTRWPCWLQQKGHQPLIAYNSVTGLEVARDAVPDLALIDLGMPILTGFDLAARLRSDPRFNSTLLVAVTAMGDAMERARKAGFDGYVVKPLEGPMLERWLSDAADLLRPPHTGQ